jgi:hypothetical protein
MQNQRDCVFMCLSFDLGCALTKHKNNRGRYRTAREAEHAVLARKETESQHSLGRDLLSGILCKLQFLLPKNNNRISTLKT